MSTISASAPKQRKTPSIPGRHDVVVATILALMLIAYAWTQRDEGHVTAETGFGYYLGIVGSTMMLLLLVYPLRKRVSAMRWLGVVPQWFRLHMVLGIVGPTLVVLHSNFTLGSLNSQVALFSMLTVAGSGYIGRFLYMRIHRGMTGHHRSVPELRQLMCARVPGYSEQNDESGPLIEELDAYEKRHLNKDKALLLSLFSVLRGRNSRRALRRKIFKITQPAFSIQKGENRKFRQSINSYLAATERAEAFTLYERLFALWHLLHLPLFLILVAAALLHILAVHLY